MLNPWALTSFKAVPERDTRQFGASANAAGCLAIDVLSPAHSEQRGSFGLRHPHFAAPFSEFFPGHISAHPIASPAPLCSFLSKRATISGVSRRKLRFCVKSGAQARELPSTFHAGATPLRHLVGIYTWTNTKTGKIYIGSSANCTRRMAEHRSRLRRGAHINAKLQAAWNKYGEHAFEFRMVFTVLDRADLEKVEQQFLDEHNAVRTGYNLAPTAGNTFGWVASPETRARMSEAAKRRDHSIQIEAMRKATTGKRRPQHVIDAMQAGRKAKGLSEASRKQMSASAVARSRYSTEDRRKMAEMHDSGMSYAKIAELVGVDAGSVYRYVARWRKDHGAKP